MSERPVSVLLVLALWLGACERGQGPAAAVGRSAARPDVTIATVDGAPITASELERRLRRVTGQADVSDADPGLRASILDQLVDERILLAEAERRGLSIPAADVEAKARAEEAAMGAEAFARMLEVEGLTPEGFRTQVGEQLLIRAILATVPPPRPIREFDVREYYEAHRREFAEPAQYRARLLTVASRPEAEALRAQLAAGADFAALATAKSISPEKSRGGDLGFVPEGRMPPEIDEAARALAPGELSPVFQSPFGFHVLRLEERRPARQQTLDQARAEILRVLNTSRAEQATEAWLANLRAKARVEILDPTLAGAAADEGASPEPAAGASAR
ncbi:MAG TPA: peptidyl-prolyl cis-trans isomerase [Thermodesulfobacteriota bacterium]